MNNILIVEDEHLIARLIEMTLTRAGYRCTLAEDGRTAADLIETTNFDMALLDIMLPGLDGYALLECLRPQGVPVIFITAKSAVKDRVQGLRLGADDYITKPFSVVEVLARVKANIRRTTEYAAPIQEPKELSFRSLKMDLSNHTVTKNGALLELTAKEFDILKLLLQNPKRVYTKAQIYSLIWNDVYVGDENAVNVHISRLRSKIEDDPRSPECVITVWGIGYKLGEPT